MEDMCDLGEEDVKEGRGNEESERGSKIGR